MSQGGQIQPPSAGKSLTFSPTAVEQNGQLVRQLQADQLPANAPEKSGGLLSAMRSNPGLQAAAQMPMPGGAGFQPMNPTQDPALAATMSGLQGLLAGSKEKKMALLKAAMGGG